MFVSMQIMRRGFVAERGGSATAASLQEMATRRIAAALRKVRRGSAPYLEKAWRRAGTSSRLFPESVIRGVSRRTHPERCFLSRAAASGSRHFATGVD